MQQDLAQVRETNRRRPEIPTMQQFAPTMANRNSQERPHPAKSRANGSPELVPGPRDPVTGTTANVSRPQNAGLSEPSLFRIPTDSDYGFAPLPCDGFPNMAVGTCPTFTPNTSQNWKRKI